MSWRSWSAVELGAVIAVGGSLLAVTIPAFFRNLSASKLSEPIEGLDRMVTSALAYAETHPQEISFPPPAPLTPAQVPRGIRALDPPEAWEHLTWKSLDFHFEEPHAFAFQFESAFDTTTGVMHFVARSHGDLDGDGALSTFEVRGQRLPGQPPRILPGMYVDREVE
ncbi:hypothetical protein [Chondromyces apiculatus]|uniref:Type II secretion system protein n=1 Tax=Chondromyces apiculatus DSM 436 TaxID=1192034 RepID=A0A017T382_9BACT|nr:hypothetical protein [Chondromyces apiculatus]EYF03688.1 Hypothetical protein CAP_5299 [Chondromyces apiculatus DSM 436]